MAVWLLSVGFGMIFETFNVQDLMSEMHSMAAAAGVYVFFSLQVDLLSVLLPLRASYK